MKASLQKHPARPPSALVIGLATLPAVGLAVFYLWPFITLLSDALSGRAVRDGDG